MSSAPPISSLRLLVPPLRLMSAFMWQIAQRQKVEHYGKLEEFVSVVTKLVPEVLTSRQKATLIMGLRAKMILEMCRDEMPADLQTVKSHIHRIQASHSSKGSDSEVESLQANLLKLVLCLLEDSAKKEHFFQEVFPVEYGPEFDKALQVLVGHFLSRLEQLLPVPNFKQTSSMLSACQWELNECVESVCRTDNLLPLMRSNICGTLEDNALPSIVEDRIISSLSHSPLMDTVISSQGNEQSDAQPPLSSDIPVQTSQDVEQEQEADDPGDHDELLASGFEETVSTEQPNTAQSLAANVESAEEDTESQHFEIEITEAIKNLEKETEMPTQVNAPIPCTEMSEVNQELENAEELEIVTSEPSLASEEITTSQSKVQITRVPLTKITLPLELSRSSKDAHNNEDPESSDSAQDPSSPSASVSSGNTPFKSSLLFSRRLHKCPRCSKRFAFRSELLKHQQTHTGSTESPKCCECGQIFKDAKQLALHRQKNCKARTYKCIKCGAGFKSLSSWYTHQRVHKAARACGLYGKWRLYL
ncbi:zinc finger protein 502-like [Astyanax mexicanus]|uniref:Zinc finger protein 502-like n=1 Tax=Astyanax mexicanus TaxID=7994 RepID=A0A8T2MB71_ASTMX|nr:zinc finger protein 502-like [Astyanax mexicanus]